MGPQRVPRGENFSESEGVSEDVTQKYKQEVNHGGGNVAIIIT